MNNEKSNLSGRKATLYIADLYEKYHKRLYCVAYKYTKNKCIAEDGVQQVFEKALKYPDRILCIPENEVYFFLYVMLRNVMFTLYNEEKRNQHISLEYADEQESYLLADPQDNYLRFINVYTLHEKLAKLTPPLRYTLLLHYIYGFKYKEIAEMFQVSERTIKSRICLAKKRLKTMLRKEDFYEK